LISIKQIEGLIKKTLSKMGRKFASDDAVELVMGTGLVESRYKYIRQLGDGPARSFWQVEPATAVDNCQHYLKHRPGVMRLCSDASLVDLKYWQNYSVGTWADILEINMSAGIIHCRLKYWRVPKRMPNTTEGMANYWKEFYNTHQGAGHIEDYMDIVSKYL